ncbi:MAG: SBBP repeat-containing protein [Candidatus Aegiribacteria sp.]|nr:SBBP repeat-containing protein [Candidatus Aegiribacteria sp.]
MGKHIMVFKLLAIMLICMMPVDALEVYEEWVVHHDGPYEYGVDEATDMVLDPWNNIIVTGSHQTGSQLEFCTIKYDGDGNEVWKSTYGPTSAAGVAVAVDSDGNIYVTGWVETEFLNKDMCTVKYDSNGNELWVAIYAGSAGINDSSKDIAVDIDGNAYVVGYVINDTERDICTIKYDSDGNEIWVSTFDGPAGNDDMPYSMYVDDNTNVYIAGSTTCEGLNLDACTIKYDSEGNELWTSFHDGSTSNWDVAKAIAVDDTGNVFITGQGDGGDQIFTIKYDDTGNEQWVTESNGYNAADLVVAPDGCPCLTGSCHGAGSDDILTVKYDPVTGAEIWSVTFNGSNNNLDGGYCITVDSAGNIYVGGSCMCNTTGQDMCTIAYDSDGNESWVMTYGYCDTWPDIAQTVIVDPFENVYVTGYSLVYSPSNWDWTTIKYNQESVGIDPISAETAAIPEETPELFLYTPYPNPSFDVANFVYSLSSDGNVMLSIYDLSGRRVETLVDTEQTVGWHQAIWDCSDVPPGVYVYRLESFSGSLTQHLIVSR